MTVAPTRIRRGRSPYAQLAIAAGCLLAFAVMLGVGATAQRGLPGSDHYDLTADFASAANLTRYSEVRIAGKRVGQVTGVSLHDGVARVHLQLDKRVRPLRAGTTARIRLKGLFGAKFVELQPSATGAPLADGATIPVAKTSTTVELFDVVSALDAKRRTKLRDTLRGLGTGFLGRGHELNDALGTFPGELRDLTAATSAVDGGAAARLFPSASAAAAAFDPARTDLATGFAPEARSLAPFADRRAAVQQALAVAPTTLDALRTGLYDTTPLLDETARLARDLVPLTRPAPAALRETTALLRESPGPLRTADTLLRRLQSAVPPTVSIVRRVDPLAAPLVHTLRDGLPLLHELTRRSCDYLGFVRNWRSMLAYGVPSANPIGPQTGLRTTLVGGGATAGQVIADGPANPQIDVGGYPPACALGPVAPLGAATR